MAKRRIFQIAKELNISHTDILSFLKGKGIEEEGTYLNLSSGYVTRAIDRMPKHGSKEPWKGNQSYLSDVTEVRWGSITNDDLHFKTANQ